MRHLAKSISLISILHGCIEVTAFLLTGGGLVWGRCHRSDWGPAQCGREKPRSVVRRGRSGRGQVALPEKITLPTQDDATLSRMRAKYGPNWLGPTRPLPSEIAGTWAWTPEGKRVWRVTILAPGARALRVRFENFNIEGFVWLYGDEWNSSHIGPYRARGPHGDESFWSEFVFAEAVTVEYMPAATTSGSERVPFRILRVAKIVDEGLPVPGRRSKDPGARPLALAGCHLDVSCFPDRQVRDQPSVARLYITNTAGTGTCTGFLINPQYDSDSRLLFLTAGHCISTEEEAPECLLPVELPNGSVLRGIPTGISGLSP